MADQIIGVPAAIEPPVQGELKTHSEQHSAATACLFAFAASAAAALIICELTPDRPVSDPWHPAKLNGTDDQRPQ